MEKDEKRKFKGLILDMDGVFAETEPYHFQAFRTTFTPLGIELTDDYLFGLVGDPTLKNLQDISRDFRIDIAHEEFDQTLERSYLGILAQTEFGAKDGVWTLIEQAKLRAWKVGLCTSSTFAQTRSLIRKVIEHDTQPYEQDTLFDAIVTQEVVINKKPHPEPYLLAAEKMKIEPEICVAIEDSAIGIASAKAAGCFCVGLNNFYNNKSNLKEADLVVNRLDELLSNRDIFPSLVAG
jgi:beta-phosphoglucomutase